MGGAGAHGPHGGRRGRAGGDDGRAAAQGARGGRGTPRATTSAAGTCSAQCAQRLHALAAGGGPRRDGQGSRPRAATGLRG
eukprot:scaffold17489_cov55-Phaeocystis_antarctica.AAC.1